MAVLAGCGNDTSGKAADNTTEDASDTADTSAAESSDEASVDEDALEDLDADFSQDGEEEIIDADTNEDVTLDPITPSDYLVENAASYVTLGDYDGVEVTKYTYEITDDMVQDEIHEELADASEEESTNAPSEDGDIVYLTLTSTVEGEEAGDPEETFITLGQEEYGAEFDQKLTGVSTGDKVEFTVEYGDDIWQEEWIGKKVAFSAEVTDVTKSITPEYNEDYVKEYTGYDTVEEYEASVKEYLQESYEEQSYYDEVEALMAACIDRTTFTGEYQRGNRQRHADIRLQRNMNIHADALFIAVQRRGDNLQLRMLIEALVDQRFKCLERNANHAVFVALDGIVARTLLPGRQNHRKEQ